MYLSNAVAIFSMKFKQRYLAIIGIAIFIYIIFSTGPEKIFYSLISANISLLFLSTIILIPALYLKGIKWKILTDEFKVKLGVNEATKISIIGISFGTITPGRIGELSRAFYLSKKNLNLGKSLSSIFLDRLFDIISLVVLSFLGLIFILSKFYFTSIIEIFIIFIIVYSVVFIALTKKKITFIIARPFFNSIIPEKYKDKLKLAFDSFYDGLNLLKRRKMKLMVAFILSLADWLISFVQSYIILLAFGYNISYFNLIFIIPLSVLVTLIPISIAGLGTREATFIYLFSLFSIPPEISVSYSIASLVFSSLLVSFFGLILWSRNPVKIKL